MAIVDLVMPKMGESIVEATVLKWLKNPGDTVKMDETILEIATDKVDSEVPSTAAGIIAEVLFKENDVVPVGTIIARIQTHAGASIPAQHIAPAPVQDYNKDQRLAYEAAPAESYNSVGSIIATDGNRFYSPLVLNIASKEGINMSELEHIPGTGNEGRVTKRDIIHYVEQRKNGAQAQQLSAAMAPAQQAPPAASQAAEKAPVQQAPYIVQPAAEVPPAAVAQQSLKTSVTGGNVEIIEMDRMRKLIADHMVRSVATSPHVTSFTEADVTNIVRWREKNKTPFEKKYGEKITYTPIFIEAIVNCIRKFPLVNCSIDGNNIIIKKDINIGMATALPSGNLIVPVIKNADTKNLLGLSKDVNSLANSARNNKLKADDTQGGTFTVTNVGTFGSLMGTPIINQPQVAILALGAIKKRAMVMETADGDVIAIRHMMYLSLSYDHRIVDGSIGASFLTAVANELEAFDVTRAL
jgi:2-oxoglutarate dehydrogenase E2 component (dihydrolipoamide succinyltransferase)